MTPLQSLALIILITVLAIAISVVTDVAIHRPAPVYRCPYCQRRYGDDTVAGCAMCADDPWGQP